MCGRLPPLPLDALAALTLGVTVLAFVGGSSSVVSVRDVAGPGRWVALLALLAVAVAWVARGRGRLPPPAVLAVAAVFLGLALLSSLWSVDPGLSAARAFSVVLLFAGAILLAWASAGRIEAVERLLAGLLGGAAAAAAGSVVLLAVDRGSALQAATYDVPARYQGLGENPNTLALLFALALPIAAWFALTGRRRSVRVAAAVALLVFVGSIGASGSRGALGAAFLGVFLVVALAPRPPLARVAAAVATVVLVAAGIAAGNIADPAGPAALPSAPDAQRGRYADAEAALPLSFEIGGQPPLRRLLGSSGRFTAWQGAIEVGAARPVVGYGFGSERAVFVDRYTEFQAGLVENSYLGIYLQLGIVGLALLLALVGALLAAMVRGLRTPVVVACLGVVAAGLALAAVQSYVYSVGNVGTVTLWVASFLGIAAAAVARLPRVAA